MTQVAEEGNAASSGPAVVWQRKTGKKFRSLFGGEIREDKEKMSYQLNAETWVERLKAQQRGTRTRGAEPNELALQRVFEGCYDLPEPFDGLVV